MKAAEVLGQLGKTLATPHAGELAALLKDPAIGVRSAAAEALERAVHGPLAPEWCEGHGAQMLYCDCKLYLLHV